MSEEAPLVRCKNSPNSSIVLSERNFLMNKIQLKPILVALILPTAIAVDAGAHERGRKGHVVDVQPVYETRIVHRQVPETRCYTDRQTSRKRVHDAMLGSLFGAIIGNELSDAPGFGTLGAAVGLGLSESRYQNDEKCKTVWRPERQRVRTLSHYDVSVAHRGRLVRLESEYPYQAGEHIHFAN
jgi:uncharacterized protein YcfJ